MTNPFPQPIRALAKADIPLDGITAYLSQSDDHQIVFMEFSSDVEYKCLEVAFRKRTLQLPAKERTVDNVAQASHANPAGLNPPGVRPTMRLL